MIYILVWFVIGFINQFLLWRVSPVDKITLDDVLFLIRITLSGPIGFVILALLIYDDYKDTVVWRRKDKK